MKKLLLILVTCFLFVFSVQAEEQATISNVTCELKSNGEISSITPTINNLDISIDDTTFYAKGDYLNCDITIKNNTSTDLKLNTSNITKLSTKNVKYSINDDKLKSNKEGIYKLSITYDNETNEEKTIGNNVKLAFTDKDKITNPYTGQISIIGIVLILIAISLVVLFKLKNKKNITFLFLTLFVLVGLNITSASSEISINLHNTINIITPTYKLNIDPQGGSYDGNLGIQEYNIKRGSTKEISNPSKEGYTFVKWNVSGNESNFENNTFTMGREDSTLTAEYRVNEYTLTINPNDGEYNGSTSVRMNYNTSTTLEEITREGYTFTGWSVSSGTLNGNEYTISSSDATITANWVANNYPYIVYHNKMNVSGSGYTLVSADTEEGEKEYGSTYTPNTRNYTGFTSPSKQSITIQVDTNPPTKNKVDYNYKRNKYTLTINRNNGSTNSSEQMYYEATKTITQPTKTGYNFNNWTVSSGSMTNNTFTMGSSNATLTANYTPINYTITYVLGGGTLSNQVNNYTIESNTITLGTPVREGYTFTGWTGSNGTTPQTSMTIPTGSTGNKTYTSNWTSTSSSTAEFNWDSTATSTTYYTLGGKKFISTGTANLLLLAKYDSTIGLKNWSDANKAANSYMPTYNSRLMTKAEAQLMDYNGRKFSYFWWLSSAASSSRHYYVSGTLGEIRGNYVDGYTHAVRPVITVPSGAVITGGEGTSGEPYEITVP